MMKNFIHKTFPVLINLYTIWILYMMFFAFNRNSDEVRYEIYGYPFESIGLLLTSQDSLASQIQNLTGNVVLFIPYGFLGILYPKLNHYKLLFPVFFLAINYLEFTQYYFSRGFAEFDDVMLNSIGMSIGFLIYRIFFKKS